MEPDGTPVSSPELLFNLAPVPVDGHTKHELQDTLAFDFADITESDAFDKVIHAQWHTLGTLFSRSRLPSISKIILGFATQDATDWFWSEVPQTMWPTIRDKMEIMYAVLAQDSSLYVSAHKQLFVRWDTDDPTGTLSLSYVALATYIGNYSSWKTFTGGLNMCSAILYCVLLDTRSTADNRLPHL